MIITFYLDSFQNHKNLTFLNAYSSNSTEYFSVIMIHVPENDSSDSHDCYKILDYMYKSKIMARKSNQ